MSLFVPPRPAQQLLSWFHLVEALHPKQLHLPPLGTLPRFPGLMSHRLRILLGYSGFATLMMGVPLVGGWRPALGDREGRGSSEYLP